ncbi:hypothetical protein HCX49_08350 [Sphingobacterium kitahiroshimense]|uniref:hypothetical protein n=1 Tax=Sphingobacterium sp. B16(2022) TaxID=2914044 RepID=UPI00143B0AC0|nr:hypothetical protein [Sphingobacterium sp. B16(2022)]NJI73214.1 hypothetical protein [Sphingobacterium sp. B16(2022)]
MSYLEFNRWAYEYYRTTTLKNGVCCLAIDEYEIAIFKRKYSLDNLYFKEIRLSPWSNLLCSHNYGDVEIPIYFGLIALQCLAASSMENSERVFSVELNEKAIKISAGNFWSRFCDITGIEKEGLLNFYVELKNNVPIQEVIWESVGRYLKDNLGFQLTIPPAITGTGRYIQYPKSQVVLNKEDLKEIANKVLVCFDLEEAISEEQFYSLFQKEFLLHNFYRNNNKINYQGSTRDIFFKQVFNYYNSGEWRLIESKIEMPRRHRKIKYVIEFSLSGNLHFYNQMTEIHQPYEIFKGGEVNIFEKVAGSEEFEQSSLFSLNTELIIVSTSTLKMGCIVNHKHVGLNIVRCTFNNEKDIPFLLRDKLRKTRDEIPVYLKGIRLGHTWQYIQNFGPEIIGADYSILYTDFTNTKEQLILEGYDSLSCKPGLYIVRVAGFTSLRFIVLEQKGINIHNENEMGLKLNSFTIDTTGILLKGLQLYGQSCTLINNKIHINGWVKANIGQDFSSKSTFLKSIKYKHYE